MKYLTFCVVASASLLSNFALAHYPTLDCEKQDNHIFCTAGYSDGSPAYNEIVEVRDYDETLLISLTSNTDGLITFNAPNIQYYIYFDPGHEDPAEFDYAEFTY